MRKTILFCTLVFLFSFFFVVLQKNHEFPKGVDTNTLKKGNEILEKMAIEIKDYFKTKPNEIVFKVSQNPINEILKVENKGTHYYAVYNYELGKGSYSQVLLAKNINTNEWFAVKVQPYSVPEDIQHEIKQLSVINEYKGDTIVDNQKHKTHYLFSTLANGNSVEKLYLNYSKHNTEDILNIIISSFHALEYLHQKNVVHNDIHEGNLVYNPIDKKSHWIDMAFSLKLGREDEFFNIKSISKNPPLCHKAPESNTKRGYSTDIYQLGFMSLRLLLILSEDNKDLKKKYIDSREYNCEIINTKFKSMSIEAHSEPMASIYNLLFRMMDPKIDKRPTITDAISEFELNYNTLKSKKIKS